MKPGFLIAGIAVAAVCAASLFFAFELTGVWVLIAFGVATASMLGSGFLLNRSGLPQPLTIAVVALALAIGFFRLGPWGFIYLAAAIALVVVWFVRRRMRERIERVGISATAEVLESRRTGTVINNQNVVTKVTLKVRPPGAEPFVTTVRATVPMGLDYARGDTLRVLVDPERPGRAVIDVRPPAND